MSALVARLTELPRSRVIIAGLAVLMTVIVMTGFLIESRWGYSGKVVPVVFFNSWPATRSVADVRAERAAEVTAARSAAATSREYIATLPKVRQPAAQAQYDAFVSAQPKSLQPEGYVAPPPPPAAKPATPRA